MKYKNLRREGAIGRLNLKNRIVMPSMGTALSSADGEVTDHEIAYFEERAKGGVGLIITEVTSVDYNLGKAGPSHPRVDDNKFIPMLFRLANTVHKYDTKIFMQLHHAGRQGYALVNGGQQIVAPSPVTCGVIGEPPRELTEAEIKELIDRFIMGAVRCKMAGIDGVEIHGAHGYLVNQFLSPYTNKRTDDYGGCFEKRMKFAKEIIEGIKQACGKDFPVIIRLSIDEFVEGGIDLEEGIKIAKYMESAGVDAINVSCGIYESMDKIMEPITYEEGWRTYLAEAVKKQVTIPVITVGVLRSPEVAEKILADNHADFVAIGRGLIAEPEWPKKVLSGREKELRKCISCLHCIDNAFVGAHLTCAINARVGRELEFKHLNRDGAHRKVVVAGGGPGGMEAARVLATRGFDVVLFEKEKRLGGQINFGNKPRGKEKMNWLVDYLQGELERLNVSVVLNQEATVEKIKAEGPYAVFVATGGLPILPNIPGMALPHVCSAEKALFNHKEITNKKVAVIGAGMTGCETADLLALQGNEVSLVEMMDEVATGAGTINKMDIEKHLKDSKVKIYTKHKLVEIQDNKIVVENLSGNETSEIGVDRVVVSLGVKPNNSLYNEVKEKFANVHLLGDAVSARKISFAIMEGFQKAFVLE